MIKAYRWCVIFIVSLSIYSCNNGKQKGAFNIFGNDYVSVDSFKNLIKQDFDSLLQVPDSLLAQLKLTNVAAYTAAAYQLNDFAPIWFDADGILPAINEMINNVATLIPEGVEADSSALQAVQNIITEVKNTSEPKLENIKNWDKSLTSFYLSIAHHLQFGKPIKPIDNQWFVQNDTVFTAPSYLVNHLKKDKKTFPAFDTFRSTIQDYTLILKEIQRLEGLKKDSTYTALKALINPSMNDEEIVQLIQKELNTSALNSNSNDAAQWLSKFQAMHQLKETGKLDDATLLELKKSPTARIQQLKVNLERLRNLPQHLGNEYVWVNIPQMELFYNKENKTLFHANVIVGKPARATPSIAAPMTNIVFNPPWGVPPTILKNDVGPGIARAGSGYLARKGLRAYDSRGRDVTASVNASNYRKYMISQPPGARNALGDVKFNMPNKEAIFIHDTPDRGNFKNANRALSSGCIRTERPRALAALILNSAEYTESAIADIVNTRKTKSQDLKVQIPVYIMYLTVAPNPNGNGIIYLKDIYGRDKKMLAQK